jgi:hypothetical protein
MLNKIEEFCDSVKFVHRRKDQIQIFTNCLPQNEKKSLSRSVSVGESYNVSSKMIHKNAP